MDKLLLVILKKPYQYIFTLAVAIDRIIYWLYNNTVSFFDDVA